MKINHDSRPLVPYIHLIFVAAIIAAFAVKLASWLAATLASVPLP